MTRPTLVPPLKYQGIKTKLVPTIQGIANGRQFSRWVEPFCGSCVVALNVQPKKALLGVAVEFCSLRFLAFDLAQQRVSLQLRD